MRLGVLLVLWAGVLLPAFAQNAPLLEVHPDYTVRQWSLQDGLPTNSLNDVLQAQDGYLWVGSNDGVARFDGERLTVFNTDNTPTLPTNRIGSLVEGGMGRVWLRTTSSGVGFFHGGQYTLVDPEGVDVLSVEGDTAWVARLNGLYFYTAGRLEAYQPPVIDRQASATLRDRQGRLWVGMKEGGLYRFDLPSAPATADGAVRYFAEADGLPALEVMDLLEDRAGNIWAGLDGGLVRIVGDSVTSVLHPDGALWGRVRIAFEDGEGGVWIGLRREGWWRLGPSGGHTLLPASGTRVHHLQQGPEGQLWHIQRNRLYRGDTLILQTEGNINTFALDSQGHVWVGVARAGLFRLSRSVLRTIGVEEGLPGRIIHTILEDRQGTVWAGTAGKGLARLEGERITQVIRPDEGIGPLYEDRAGRLWIDAKEMCRVEETRCVSPATPLGSATAMLEDRQGRFWIGGRAAILMGTPDEEDYTWTSFPSDSLVYRVRTILETRDGALLFGTMRHGILRYIEASDRRSGGTASDTGPEHFEALTTEHGLASNSIRDLYEDRDGYLWVAHEDRGLCRVDPSTRSGQIREGRQGLAGADIACISTGDGLYWHGLHRILEDDYGRFWFNTNNGLFWVERAALQAYFAGEVSSVSSVSYTEADGMRNREGNGGRKPAGMKARDGRLWFPTQQGIVIADPAAIGQPTPPLVVIEALQVGPEARLATEEISLRAEEREITLRYTALEFGHPEDVRFQYQLQGYDQTWREGGRERFATYTNLPPGRYVFQVRAALGGSWGEVTRLTIDRAPFFWETRWFQVLFGLFLVAVAGAFYAIRVRHLKAREVELESLVAERTATVVEQAEALRQSNEHKARFLANISHEFRTPLTLTFGPIDDVLNGRYDIEEAARPHFERARRNGSRLLRLINQLLDLSKLDAGALLLRPKRQDLAQHLRQLAALFDSIAETQGIDYSKRIPSEPLWHVYDSDKLEKVVINLLSNAFKFTPEGRKVALSLEATEEGGARLSVADTGPGIPEEALPHLFDRFYQVEGTSTRSHEGSGIGLALVKELVDLHEGTIEVESQVGFGTRFTVRLPLLVLEEAEAAPEQAPAETIKDEAAPWEALPDEAERVEHTISGSLRIPQGLAPEPVQTLSVEDTVVLVVEDNADMRQYIRAHLEAHFAVIEAENGKVGVERALEMVPDLVLSDVMMPEMDGLEACAALKADERTSHIPVVLLTAKAQVEHRIEGFESGADAYLPKPFNAEELVVRVRTLIEERRRLRTRFAGQGPTPQAQATMQAEEAVPTTTEEVASPVLPPREAAFVETVRGLIEENLADAHFSIDHVAEAVAMSRRQVTRKLKALIDETPGALLRRRRLEQAAVLLSEGALSVKEVGYAVGFQSMSSFARAFREAYGVPPSEYNALPPASPGAG